MNEQILYPEMTPQGLIKIELFEDGKRTQEVNTHNFISKGMREYFFKMMIKNLFIKRRVTGGMDLSYFFSDLFKCMHLTDANHPEDPDNEWALKGKEVGYAFSDTTYSGSDNLQGSYNPVESFSTIDKVRMVFDFPTHAAIGTFQSIFFSSRNTSYGAYSLSLNESLSPFKKLNIPFNIYSLTVKKYGDKIYRLRNDNYTIDVYSASNVDLIKSVKLPHSAVYDFEIVDDYMYIVSPTASRAIYKLPLSDLSTYEVILSDLDGYGGICYDEGASQFVLARSKNSDYVVTIYRYDKNFNKISETKVNNLASSYSNIRIYYAKGTLILLNKVLLNDSTVDISPVINSNSQFYGIIDDYFVGQYSTGYPIYLIPLAQIGSRCLLPEPIVKTNAKTMKITYDFILE